MNDESIDKVDQQIEQTVKQVYQDKETPDHLWSRIQNSVQSEASSKQEAHKRSALSWVSAGIAASGLLAAVAVVVYSLTFNTVDDTSMVEALIGEHDTFVASGRDLDIGSSDIDTLNRWFGQRIDSDLLPDAPVASHIKLAGGRLCQIKGMRIASYAYKYKGKTISLYLTKLTDAADGEDSYAVTVEVPPDVEIAKFDDSAYASWQNAGWQYFLVGNLEVEQFRKISSSLSSVSATHKS